MLRFLDRILASQGLRCGVSIDAQKRVSQRWFKTNHELESYLLDASELCDAYHCNATFLAPGSRRKNADCLYKAVWADIDLAFDTALAGLKASCERGLPIPNIIVSSGGGLHAYWIFTRDLSLDEWGRVSEGLSSAAHKYGLVIDNKCTIDAVRILRPPGTINRKYAPKPTVEWTETGAPDYDFEKFLPAAVPLLRSRSVDHGSRALGNGPSALIPYAGPPASAYRIAEKCANIKYFKDTGCAKEGEEPLWKACVGVVAYADNGDALVHEWSAKDLRYNGPETNEKILQRKKNQTGASLCRQFEDETDLASKSRCEKCNFYGRLNSPISLGYADDSTADHGVGQPGPDSNNVRSHPAGVSGGPVKHGMPDGYRIGSGVKVMDWGDTHQEMEITSFPLFFLERTQGEAENSEHLDVWEHQLPHRNQRFSINAGEVNYVSKLKKNGVIIWNSAPLLGYISACQKMEALKRDRTMHYGCYGWKLQDREFLWGDMLFRVGGRDHITIVDKSLSNRAVHLRPGGRNRKGNLGSWKSAVRGLLQPGFEVQQLALLASVGSIFIHFLAPSEGGAILHFVNKSGTGKTTALKVAASVWGDLEGLSSTLDDTATSKSIKFGYLRHLPLIFDELAERDPTATEKLIRTFTVGTDKSRALVDGSGLQENNREWSTILISAANRSIVDTVNLRSRSAMAQRVLEFEKEFPLDISVEQKRKGQWYANEVAANCGWAGEAVLSAIFESEGRIKALEEALWQAEDDIRGANPSWTQDRRYWTRAMASIKVAGALMHGMELIDFDYERVIRWACDELNERDTRELSEQMAPVDALTAYLDENRDVTLVMAGAWMRSKMNGQGTNVIVEGYKPPYREVYIRREIDTNTIMIDKAHFRTWLVKNDQFSNSTISALEKENLITGTSRVILSAGTELQSGQKQCLRVDGRRLSSLQPAASREQ